MSNRPKYFFENITAWIGSTPSFVVHTVVFAASFAVGIAGIAEWDTVLLVLTTVVSLEAIYLAIFIQMTVNRQTAEIHEVSEDVEEIQEELEEISEDVEEISEDVEEIQEDVEEMSEDWDLGSGEPRPAGGLVTLDQLTDDVKKILISLEQLKKK